MLQRKREQQAEAVVTSEESSLALSLLHEDEPVGLGRLHFDSATQLLRERWGVEKDLREGRTTTFV